MLSAARTAFWCERRWLVVADVHFGKAATFRALGVPVPRGTTVGHFGASQRSDRPHATDARSSFSATCFTRARRTPRRRWPRWKNGEQRYASLDLVLVEGNHDRKAGAPPATLRIHRESDPWRVDRFAFCHYPRFVQDATAFAGHLHPAVRLHGRADDSVRLPCFWLRDGLTVLPAFGAFTGGATIDREARRPRDRCRRRPGRRSARAAL